MIVTLKEAKKYLRVDHDDDDTIIRKFIRAAETLCEGTLRKAVGKRGRLQGLVHTETRHTRVHNRVRRRPLNAPYREVK